MSSQFPNLSHKSITPVQAAHMMTANERSKQLLARILFWMPKASVERRGIRMIAKSRDDWAAETTLSPIQIKKALADLRSAGIIVTGQHLFGNRNTLHTGLTKAGAAILGILQRHYSFERCY